MKILFSHIILILVSAQSTSAINFNTAINDTVTVRVVGSMESSRFVPSNIEIEPGDVLRFIVEEGVHTVTAYHPDNRRERGIPKTAESFDSGVLQAGEQWYLQPTVTGEYNYFCRPHERMGHKGKFSVR